MGVNAGSGTLVASPARRGLRRLWPPRPAPAAQPVVLYFDGVCGLCNRSVDFLLARDPEAVLRFAPLQGQRAGERLGEERAAALDGVWLEDEDGLHAGSDAVLRALDRIGGPWRAVSWLRAVPRPLRDRVYGGVVRRRYQWFGKRETCRLPTPEERERFLD